MDTPTEQELNEKQAELPEGYERLSEVQFSAQMTAEKKTDEKQTAGSAAPENDYLSMVERQQEEIDRRDREILAALDKVLNNSRTSELQQKQKPKRSFKRLAVGFISRGCGLASLSLTLIMMGIVLICLFFSAEQDFTPLMKLAPISAVFYGIELLLSWLASGRKIRINIPCTVFTVVITAGCCILSAALSRTIAETEQQFSDRSAEAFIYEESYSELKHRADISRLTVTVDLNLEGGRKRASNEFSPADDIEIAAELDGRYASPEEFAAECSQIVEVYQELDIPVDSFRFVAETRLMSFSLDIEGKFQQDFSEEKLTGLVRYVIIEDYDFIHDLADLTEETGENTAEN